MLIKGVCLAGAATVVPLLTVGVADADPGECAVIDSIGRCLVAAADPGRPGGPSDRRQSDRSTDDGSERSGRQAGARPFAAPIEPNGPAVDAALFGAAAGRPPADPAAAVPVPQPAVLAQMAVEELTLQPPSIQLSAAESTFVGVPVWLWIERGQRFTGPVRATATAGAARVEATGRLVAVEWSMGPDGAVVRCTGPGTPWTAQTGPSPDCGYVYEQRSLPGRTGGTGRWRITATSVWQVEWSGVSDGAPVSGAQTVRVSSETSLAVGEVQVLISGGGE